ncbi:hypothetical protein [Amycolatopsis sp. NPDC098790]|uniref:hypothetical protein n=1 Tax=Amycolatopsis sp. NPDC098790 TaxID=3363939 RepID=UPI003802BDD9
MHVYEIVVPGGDEVPDFVTRSLCPEENHTSPCPVPWFLSRADGDVLLVVACTDQSAAADVARRVGGQSPVVSDTDEYDFLIEQYRIERGLQT